MEMIIGYLHQGFSAIVPFIVLLGLLIFVHELGHFLVAKFFGVRVEVFSLGFGKKIAKYKRGDTTYCLSIIPLGGYVKMFGDDIGATISESDKKFSFLHKPVYQRIGIVLAGPLMNFFFAILIFFIVGLIGEETRGPVIGDVPSDTPAYQVGFRSGDTILRVGNDSVKTWDEFQEKLNSASGGEVPVEVKREVGGTTEVLRAKADLKPNPNILSLDSEVADISGISVYSRQSVIGVRGSSYAEKSGLKTGDRLLAINGHPIRYFREIENSLISQSGQSIALDIERPTADENKFDKVKIDFGKPRFSSLDGLGIDNPALYLSKVVEKSPAHQAGLKEGDRIIRVGKITPEKWEDVLNTVKSYPGSGPLEFEVERGSAKMTFQVTPQMTSQMTSQGGEEKRYTVGVMPSIFVAAPIMTIVRAETLGVAMTRGLQKTVDVTAMTVLSFLRLVQNKISPKNIGGVISIGQAASETYKRGISYFLQMMAIISINLFILNLLPIPVLDGGHLLFYTIEALKGAPMSMRKMEIAQQVGLVVLMSLMVFALFNDFSRILGVW